MINQKIKTPLVGVLFGLALGLSIPGETKTAYASYSGGSGTSDDPYLISNAEELKFFNEDTVAKGASGTVGVHYLLTDDIDFTGYDTDTDASNGNWTPIPFKGTFDGGEHTISNLTVKLPNKNDVGMFSMVADATIKNFVLKDVSMEGLGSVGGLSGYLRNSFTSQVGVTGSIRGNSSSVGGISGSMYGGEIENAYAVATINAPKQSYIGGLIGYIKDNPTIGKTYASGTVSGLSSLGGLIGYNVGSFTITQSYWDVERNKYLGKGGTAIGSAGLNTPLAYHVLDGFDFDTIWNVCANGTPLFQWEKQSCTVVPKEDLHLNGAGTQDNPYLIQTEDDLIYFNHLFNAGFNAHGKNFLLTNDLDLKTYDTDNDSSNGNWVPIGTTAMVFSGRFDGGNHTISNLKVNTPSKEYVGMFGYVSSGRFMNLVLKNISINGSDNVGGLIGYTQSGSTISQVGVLGTINGKNSVGGVIGYLYSGTIEDSYSNTSISATASSAGGLIGRVYSGTIRRTYASGTVSGKTSVGGLIGGKPYYDSSAPANSYWDTDTSQIYSSYSKEIGLPRTQMIREAARKYLIGFDFDTVWKVTSRYPTFIWQKETNLSENSSILDVYGDINPTLLSITVPTEPLFFSIDPNEEEGQQFIAADFAVKNNSLTPLTLEVKSFEQISDVLTDVEPDHYEDWSSLNKEQSKSIALAVTPQPGEGWLSLTEGDRWVADLSNPKLGVIKGNQSVEFSFKAKHGLVFSETIYPQYRLTFILGLQD